MNTVINKQNFLIKSVYYYEQIIVHGVNVLDNAVQQGVDKLHQAFITGISQ